MAPSSTSPPEGDVIPLAGEGLTVSRRRVPTGRVRVRTVTHVEDVPVDELLSVEHADVQRVAVGREITEMPRVRREGDTLIVPIVEEVLVVQRRLVLREEVRVRRVETLKRHRETVQLRKQEAQVERLAADDTPPPASGPGSPPTEE